MKKIDVHCHTSNRPVADVETQLPKIRAIKVFMERYDIEKTVVLATYFPHKQSGISNFRLYDWIRDEPNFLMFGSMDFRYYPRQGMNELNELAERGILSGIKIYTCYQDIDLNSNLFKSVVYLAERYGLPMMFHTGISYASMRKYDTPSVSEMVTAKKLISIIANNEGVNFILSHMSKPFFEEIKLVCSLLNNAYTDMSGLIDSTFDQLEIPSTIEVIKNFLGECGPNKLLFGTDFPVQTHDHSVYFIEEAMKGYSNEDKQKVYYDNALKLLKVRG